MRKLSMGMIEARFADIIWEKEPVTTKELLKIGEAEMNWARTTTYTVLKRLCDRGIFAMKDGMVTAVLSRGEFYAIRSEQFIDNDFKGSLPDFFAAFATRKTPTKEEVEALRKMLDNWSEK